MSFRLKGLLAVAIWLLLSGCTPKAALPKAGCQGIQLDDKSLLTAAHCVQPGENWTQVEMSGSFYWALPVEVDEAEDLARLEFAGPVPLWTPPPVYRPPKVGDEGYFVGGCRLRENAAVRVTFVGMERFDSGWVGGRWVLREGNVSCPGDSGSPIWNLREVGVFHGLLSRFEKARVGVETFRWGSVIYTTVGVGDGREDEGSREAAAKGGPGSEGD